MSIVEHNPILYETSHSEDLSLEESHTFSKSKPKSPLLGDENVMELESTLNNTKDKQSEKRKSQIQRHQSTQILNMAELMQASRQQTSPRNSEGELWKSNPAIALYVLVVISIMSRRLFVLQGLPLLILFYFAKLFLSWFVYVVDAKEIRELKGLAKWWINFGLRFSTKTIRGDRIHGLLTAFTVNFWKGTGFNYATSIYRSISQDARESFLRHARENLNRAQMTNMKMKNILSNQHRSKK
ncbi:hypothetical protein IV203_030266 [Nitzschia inconspicua]|uniref:Uncharacterized protein n=1 Tax=Nitzschia inconspicua TaxID=303405 RepID=A0A9K3LS82_9STRA|nr:hypothetical protein IV203_030266 [Nitzschia inconspicua]